MTIRVKLNHVTHYQYDRRVSIGPQTVRLRPALHCRTPIESYSLSIDPADHYINWQQDPHGNFLARLIFNDAAEQLRIEVDLIAEMKVINPFDYFIEEYAEKFPFTYEQSLLSDLKPYLETDAVYPIFRDYLATIDHTPRRTIDFLVDLNRKLESDIEYLIRMEPGVQSCQETLQRRSGSCRDSAWLLVQILRQTGLAARFVSGYLIQLRPDIKSLDGPSGPDQDFTDLHAWSEVYVPGAGWIGLDPTSGLFADEGHIPLACTPNPLSAAPITGTTTECKSDLQFSMCVTRVQEEPRVTKPYTQEQWQRIVRLGDQVDERLREGDVRLTMGGEPTFVSIDDMESPEWNISAVGLQKRRLSAELIGRLRNRFAPGGLMHFGQGKWYPGESLPRWADACFWRTDGEPIWVNPNLIADPSQEYSYDWQDGERFVTDFAAKLDVEADWVVPAYEDVWYLIEQEQRLPVNVDLDAYDLDDSEDRHRLARVIEQGADQPVGFVLPLRRQLWQARARWQSGPWPLRSQRMHLIPGDSPVGLRLPLESLPAVPEGDGHVVYHLDPFAPRHPLPHRAEFEAATITRQQRPASARSSTRLAGTAVSAQVIEKIRPPQVGNHHDSEPVDPAAVIRTAMCVEVRGGRLHVFMPPVDTLEDYLELVSCVEETAEAMQKPVVVEGYLPPADHRLNQIKVTPDPGVLEVNVHPAHDWRQLIEITTAVYENARLARLGTEKFQLDGRHAGTGGGNHMVLGGPTPADSPFLRRPNLLRSLLGYWNNHPALSYLFSGMFIGPTSQAPRVDEGRRDALYELQIAFSQIPDAGTCPPWLVDRVFRHLLVDLTGNTHRAEFCIDKLYSPDAAGGRLGLVEFRAFEMPPHSRMSLVQQLLLRALVARFWETPYTERLIDWKTALHDRFMLPYFLESDFRDVVGELRQSGFDLEYEWFAPHLAFRCPLIGEVNHQGVRLQLQQAIEPWYVLGEEPGATGTARYVDSSVERLQVRVIGLIAPRHVITCNGRKVPLQATEVFGEFVGAVRYRAWQPPSCLHPTVPVHTPLIFDIVDTYQHISLGGCQYHVGSPGGLNPQSFPVNALEAESRRGARFFKIGHSGGRLGVPADEPNVEYPMTLDLRRSVPRP